MASGEHSTVSRRGFLAGGVAAGLLASESTAQTRESATAQVVSRRRRPLFKFGLQLYSVRNECQKELVGTIAAVGKMGYQGVEFAGYYGQSAKDLRKLLDDNGLVCCGTHTGMDTLLGDNLGRTIEYNQTLGNKYLIVPGLAEKYRNSQQAWLDTAKLFSELAAKAKEQGMRVGYHNHSVEFQPMEGTLPWETMWGNASEDVVMQLDTGNALHGGADPLPFLYRYPGRAITVHVKEFSKTNDKALIGEGDINWQAFFALCTAVGGTEWYIVEQESYAYPPLECVKRCLQNLRKMKLPRVIWS